jgi:hypothetical protein
MDKLEKLLLGAIGVVLLILVLVFGAKRINAVTVQRDEARAQVVTAKKVLDTTVAGYEANLTKERADQALARKASADYEKAFTDLSTKYDAARAALRAAGGLRINRAAVCGGQGATAPAAAGTGRPDEAATGTVALPEKTSDDLLRLTEEADALGLRLAKLQNWIRSAGLYGPPETSMQGAN